MHNDYKGYRKALAVDIEQAPVAEGAVWRSEPAHELEEIRDGERHMRICTREFLTQVAARYVTPATATLNGVGQRLLVRALSPESIGGRVQKLSELFESHKCLRADVVYSPVVPTNTKGALAMAFYNDIAVSTQLTGVDAMVHASSAGDHYIQFPVWKGAELHIDPELFTKRIADEQEGDARFTTDGLLEVLLAGTVDNAGPNDEYYGNLYIVVEYDFWSPLLDVDISTPVAGTVTLTAGAATGTTLGAAFCALGPAPGAFLSWTMTGLTLLAAPDYLLTLTLHAANVTLGTQSQVRELDSVDPYTPAPGMTFFCRAARAGTGTDTFLFFFDSIEAASDFVFDQAGSAGAITSGQLVYDATSAPGLILYTLEFQMSAMDISSSRG